MSSLIFQKIMHPPNSSPVTSPPSGPTPQYRKTTLEHASSVKEILVAVKDVVQILQRLAADHQILHKHIDYNNVAIRREQLPGAGSCEGVVLDLDFPDSRDGSSASNNPVTFMGSYAFSSVRKLGRIKSGTPVAGTRLRVGDDFESVLYVLCWACYGYDHNARPDKFRPDWLRKWAERGTASNAYYAKTGFLENDDDDAGIRTHVNRYMGCDRDILEEVIEKLREGAESARTETEGAYNRMLEIIQGGIERVQKERCGKSVCCSGVSSASD
ncbi:hypothetical protein R3P38DRAFT_2870671 [Favolaschia claudopus]|uniref:Fungal-type protein kinase domain-containing protein n=1 Tax=Favolaschia claudopus TaxID=2862362 RepID=A0AAW0DBW9_9AGAR